MITTIRKDQASSIAHLHRTCLPDDFLSSFGEKFLTILYRGILDQPEVLAIEYRKKNVMAGFIIGLIEPQKNFKKIILRNIPNLLPLIIIKLLVHPMLIKKCLETIRYETKTDNTVPAELLALCVNKNYRKLGIGKLLVFSLAKKFKNYNHPFFIVNTYADNDRSNAFYAHIGGRLTHSFTMYDKKWNCYVFSV